MWGIIASWFIVVVGQKKVVSACLRQIKSCFLEDRVSGALAVRSYVFLGAKIFDPSACRSSE